MQRPARPPPEPVRRPVRRRDRRGDTAGRRADVGWSAARRQGLHRSSAAGLHRQRCSRGRHALLPWALLSFHDQRSRHRWHRRLEARGDRRCLPARPGLGSGGHLRTGSSRLGIGKSGRRPTVAAERQGRRSAVAHETRGFDVGRRSGCRPYPATLNLLHAWATPAIVRRRAWNPVCVAGMMTEGWPGRDPYLVERRGIVRTAPFGILLILLAGATRVRVPDPKACSCP